MTKDERDQFIIENMGLVGMCVRRLYPSLKSRLFDYEDLFQIGCVYLIRAVDTYNPQISKFSTWGACAILNGILMAHRGRARGGIVCRRGDEQIPIINGETAIQYLTDHRDDHKDLESILDLKKAMEYLRNDEKELVIMLASGMSQTRIGQALGICQPYVSRKIKRIGEKVKLHLLEA